MRIIYSHKGSLMDQNGHNLVTGICSKIIEDWNQWEHPILNANYAGVPRLIFKNCGFEIWVARRNSSPSPPTTPSYST